MSNETKDEGKVSGQRTDSVIRSGLSKPVPNEPKSLVKNIAPPTQHDYSRSMIKPGK